MADESMEQPQEMPDGSAPEDFPEEPHDEGDPMAAKAEPMAKPSTYTYKGSDATYTRFLGVLKPGKVDLSGWTHEEALQELDDLVKAGVLEK